MNRKIFSCIVPCRRRVHRKRVRTGHIVAMHVLMGLIGKGAHCSDMVTSSTFPLPLFLVVVAALLLQYDTVVDSRCCLSGGCNALVAMNGTVDYQLPSSLRYRPNWALSKLTTKTLNHRCLVATGIAAHAIQNHFFWSQ